MTIDKIYKGISESSEDYDFVKVINHLINENLNDGDLRKAVRAYQLKQTNSNRIKK
jgi:inorganic triphosphatase YgiF